MVIVGITYFSETNALAPLLAVRDQSRKFQTISRKFRCSKPASAVDIPSDSLGLAERERRRISRVSSEISLNLRLSVSSTIICHPAFTQALTSLSLQV